MRAALALKVGGLVGVVLALHLGACASEEVASSPPSKLRKPRTGGAGGKAGGPDGEGSTSAAGGSGNATSSGGKSTGGTNAGSTSSGGAPTGPQHGLPCPVESLLISRCQSCHSDPPKGAPMALVDHADLVAPSKQQPAKTMAQASVDRMLDATSPMPPMGHEAPSAAEIAAFKSWVNQGALTQDCMGGGAGAGGSGGSGGSGQGGGANPFGGAGGALSADCQSLASCCATLDQQQATACEQAVEWGASDQGKSCAYTLSKIHALGRCGQIPAPTTPVDTARCGLQTTLSSCNDCFDAFCCKEATACKTTTQNANCGAALTCLSDCAPGNGSCQSNCAILFSEGDQTFLDVLHCVQLECKSFCGAGVGGSGGGGGGGAACTANGSPCTPGQTTCCEGSACDLSGACLACVGPGQSCFFGAPCCQGTCPSDTGVCPACQPLGAPCSPGDTACCEGSCNLKTGVCSDPGNGGMCGPKGSFCSQSDMNCCSGACNVAKKQCL